MDHLPRSGSRRLAPPTGKQPPPLLTRCKSENQTPSPPSNFTKSRSISTTKTRSYKEPDSKTLPQKKPTSPSAWALSPGRVAPYPSPSPVAVKPPSRDGKISGGGLRGVFKYFRQKKSAPSEDASIHSFKVMNNRLLQWRFVNVQAETTMPVVKAVAEKKIFNVWLAILAIRSSNMVKRVEVQKLKNAIRLYHIVNSHMFLLEKWSSIEAKNFEAVGRIVRKLTVASLNIPMLQESKVTNKFLL
ncbi:QWRF motif-containing protein 7-like [Bidens hawaiensis]|uniref:QWRF motif-containing protein 7-like n=1 Tax=Bidens hawaiensis TaxID=980011 RepID=UPI00404B3B4C